MEFAFNPDDRPPRLVRYVESGTLPGRDLLCLYDKTTNLLVIDRDWFNELPEVDQHMVLRTQMNFLCIDRVPGKLPTVRDQKHLVAAA
jgi:hypothetical protein